MKWPKTLIFILLLSTLLRLWGINWDRGFHLHPDERMIIMVADRIHFFDELNPSFYNYGTLPIYILKGAAQVLDLVFFTHFGTYNGLLLLGRFLSVLAEILTVIFIYKIGLILSKDKSVAQLGSLFYSIAFFPIQNSHFFVADVFLTFFTTVLIYFLLSYLIYHKNATLFLMSMIFAACLATKVSSALFWPILVIAIITLSLLQHRKSKIEDFLTLMRRLVFFHVVCFFFFFIFMPYAFLDNSKFLNDILIQTQMNSNAYIFPYTLQYVSTLPYFYYVKNIFLWGWGPFLSLFSLVGLFFYVRSTHHKNRLIYLMFLIFYSFYFIFIGHSAVKFMRYMLPLYPMLAILASIGYRHLLRYKMNLLLFFFALLWTFAFLHIYLKPHTRIAATNWILRNIPPQSTLAIEHWDDRLPLINSQNYHFVEMTLYDVPDDTRKWSLLNDKLTQADYIIIASNRLYTPIQKLADCRKFSVCYPKTTNYYKHLFNDQLGFTKVAEFTDYPQLALGPWTITIKDEDADESFTVYDHPKIMIFKKV